MKTVSLKSLDLKVSYDRQVALNIDKLDITGNVIAILGHNGAGKSTLLKTILNLLNPQSGKIDVSDQNDLNLIPERDMAFCPENGAVFEDIKVEDYLKVWLRIKSLSCNLQNDEVSRLINLFEISPLLHKYGRELSKGQRRRVQSVVGFLIKPKLFLFDEPFDGLDIQKTAELSDIIEDKKSDTCFLISSHRMDVIERVCDSGLVLAAGKVIASGSIEDLSESLAGKSIIFNLPPDYKLKNIKFAFKNTKCHISHIGQNLIFTGHDCDLEKIISDYSLMDMKYCERVPSLTDAMAYHLKKLSSNPA